MSEVVMTKDTGAHRPVHGRRRGAGYINLDKAPSIAEALAGPHRGEAADKFTQYTATQEVDETRNVRLDITFNTPRAIRQQAQMIMKAMSEIIDIATNDDLGSINQRVLARTKFAKLGRDLSIFNGKTPYGCRPKKR